MSRATRIEFPGALYHAMGRGVGGMKVFAEDGDFRKFLDLVGERVDGGDLLVHAFCLMSNHYHLLLETPRGGLSRWMHGILGTYAEWFNFTRKRRGHLWQGRYKAIRGIRQEDPENNGQAPRI